MAQAPNSAPLSSAPAPGEQSYFSPLAGLLSYLVPGLGQIVQGRVGKGLLFLFCLYGMFFYGMYLGDWRNVYLPDAPVQNRNWNLPDFVLNVYNRPQFAAQFWIGIAAWPALWQYNHLPVPTNATSPFWHTFQKNPPESHKDAANDWEGKTLNELITEGDKTWDLGWVYTVIAGALNVLVIYDAAAGPAFGTGAAISPNEEGDAA
jgi:hypothetical protein